MSDCKRAARRATSLNLPEIRDFELPMLGYLVADSNFELLA